MGPSGYCHRKLNLDTVSTAAAASLPRRLRPASATPRLRFLLSAFAFLRTSSRPPHPQNCTGSSSLRRLTLATPLRSLKPLSASSSQIPGLRFLSRLSPFAFGPLLPSPFGPFSSFPTPYSSSPVPFSLSLRSSPRPISIIKLHTLPHFHR